MTRRRLSERLDEGLRADSRLLLVSAPAGYGKTTLVAEWVGDKSAAWLALEDGDNGPVRFYAYLIAALREVDPELGQGVADLIVAPRLPPAASLMTPLINDIALTGRPIVLVLDDTHAIRQPAIHEALEFLCLHGPP